MGLLDDAIREHLELKRRRGADAGELERQENEALGPARRGEFAKPEGEAEVADALPEPAAEAPPAEEPPADEPPPAEEPVAEVPPPPEPVAEVPAVEEPPEAEPWLDEPDEVPVDDALEHRPEPPAPDPDVVAPDAEPAGEDVLEETPDFLQETPEHDRLWFEQKPPRDFDFDK
jgi:hypothetical protein